MEQLGSHWTDFYEIWFGVFENLSRKLKSDKSLHEHPYMYHNILHEHLYMYDNILHEHSVYVR